MEAVPAQAVLLREFGVDRIRVGGGGERLMERGVEDRDVRNRVERFLCGTDALHRPWVVEGREYRQVFDVDEHQRSHQRRLEKARPTVHDAVTNGDGRIRLQ